MMWAGRILGSLLAILAILIVVILIAGANAKANLKARYPAPGQLVDMGGYRMHISCQGEGSPTVILEAGGGDSSLIWALVQPQVAKITRVCAYDRAGFGWSDLSPKPRTAQNIVEELHILLVKSGITGPYILVGHSMGGMIIRLYAHQYPDEVAGMVLVDSVHEEQSLRFPDTVQKALAQLENKTQQQLGLFKILSTGN